MRDLFLLLLVGLCACLPCHVQASTYREQMTSAHHSLSRAGKADREKMKDMIHDRMKQVVVDGLPILQNSRKSYLSRLEDEPTTYNATISQECEQALKVKDRAQILADDWALRMIDADLKMGPGFMDGNFNLMGNFKECRNVKATYKDYALLPGTHDFDATYCRIYFPVIEDYFYISLGFCVPETCSEDDVAIIYTTPTDPVEARNVYCFEEGESFWEDGSAVTAFVIVLLFLILVAIGTGIHYGYAKTNPSSSSSSHSSSSSIELGAAKVKRSEGAVYVNRAAELDNGNRIHPDHSGENGAQTGNGPANGSVSVEVASEPVSANANSIKEPKPDDDPPPTQEPSHADTQVENGGQPKIKDENGGQPKIKDEKHDPLEDVGTGSKLLLSFSLMKNAPSVLTTKSMGRGFLCLNGIRFLSMTWIILGHTWQLPTFVLVDARHQQVENQLYLYDYMLSRWLTDVVINHMNYGVESFFVLAGSLVMISLLKMFDRYKGSPSCKEIGLYYFHRYWRLTPVYMFIIMMFAGFFPHMGEGPTARSTMQYNSCREDWWKNMLYINTIVWSDCMGWSWYVGNDFIYYCLAPFFAFFLYRRPNLGLFFLVLAWIATTAVKFSMIIIDADYFAYIYVPPYSRYGPYVIGMGLGYLMFKTKCKVHMHPALVTVGWCLAVVFFWVCQLGEHYGPPTVVQLLYDTFVRDMFALCVSWLIFACCTGYGGFVNHFLSWKFFIPLSRLTYVGYLVHPIIIDYYAMYRIRQFFVTDASFAFDYCAYLLMTIMVSFLITLVFEVPFLQLEKVMFPKKKKN